MQHATDSEFLCDTHIPIHQAYMARRELKTQTQYSFVRRSFGPGMQSRFPFVRPSLVDNHTSSPTHIPSTSLSWPRGERHISPSITIVFRGAEWRAGEPGRSVWSALITSYSRLIFAMYAERFVHGNVCTRNIATHSAADAYGVTWYGRP